MYESTEIAMRIKELAKQRNILIKEMLEECGLNKNSLSSMLSKGAIPKSENLAKIADYLSCSVDYLLGRTENPNISGFNCGFDSFTDEERLLLETYRAATVQGRFRIIQVCMNANEEKEQAAIAG